MNNGKDYKDLEEGKLLAETHNDDEYAKIFDDLEKKTDINNWWDLFKKYPNIFLHVFLIATLIGASIVGWMLFYERNEIKQDIKYLKHSLPSYAEKRLSEMKSDITHYVDVLHDKS